MTLSWLSRLALAGMVASLVGAAACAETPDATPGIEALQEFRTRANAGDADAQNYLGLRYALGLDGVGVPQDRAEAAAWYRRAADQGHTEAQSLLGFLYLNVQPGVPEDNIEAYKWFSLAATNSIGQREEMSIKWRDTAAERLTPEQLAEGQRRAREWFEAHPPE